jgi:hypothetical protein
MFGLKMLDVLIGVVFFFSIASLLSSAIRELFEACLNTRARTLETALRELLNDNSTTVVASATPATAQGAPPAKSILQLFYEHPLIDALYRGEYADIKTRTNGGRAAHLPSYIPAKLFADALLDLVAPPPAGANAAPTQRFDAIRAALTAPNAPGGVGAAVVAGNDRLKTAILWALDTADGDLDKARASLEGWFDSAMDRASGWYKQATHFQLIFIGVLMAAALNFDAIAVTQRLYYDDDFRNAIVKDADAAVKQQKPGDDAGTLAAPLGVKAAASAMSVTATEIQQLGFPIGWSSATARDFTGALSAIAAGGAKKAPSTPSEDRMEALSALGLKLLGWLMTGVAVSLGAAFWFQILGKLMSLRMSLNPNDKDEKKTA